MSCELCKEAQRYSNGKDGHLKYHLHYHFPLTAYPIIYAELIKKLFVFMNCFVWKTYEGNFEPHGFKGTINDLKLSYDIAYYCTFWR